MLEQFEKIDGAISELAKMIDGLKADNAALRRERDELRSTVDDRDLEILQLQEDAKNKAAETEGEKAEISGRLEGLLSRVSALSAPDKNDENSAF